LDDGLAFGIEGRGRLVKNENAGIEQERSGDGETLALAAGQIRAVFRKQRVVALGQILDELVRPGKSRDRDDLLEAGAGLV